MMASTHAGQVSPISAIVANDNVHNVPGWGAADGAISKYEAKEHVFFAGDDREQIYEVVEGVVCVYAITLDGRRQVISFAYPGSLLGLEDADGHLYNAEALSPVKLRHYSARTFEKVAAERPDLSQALLSFVMSELSATRDQLLTLGQKSAPEKMASFLLDLSRHNDDAGEDPCTLKLSMTRADIADYLGLTIETVSRNFTKLKCQGVIELYQYTTVIIRDIDRLEDIAACNEDCF